MDEVDLEIINKLKEDARMSYLKIGKQLGRSAKTVQTRYKKLKEKNVIWISTISIDISKIGYQGKAYLMITNAPNQDPNLTIQTLNQMQDVFIVAEILGDFDILAITLLRNVESFNNLVQEIKALPSVGQVDFVIVTDTSFPIDKTYKNLPLALK